MMGSCYLDGECQPDLTTTTLVDESNITSTTIDSADTTTTNLQTTPTTSPYNIGIHPPTPYDVAEAILKKLEKEKLDKEREKKTPVCGDWVLDLEEECDDGNTLDGDGCSNSCKIEFCGDGKVQKSTGEECDTGQGSFCKGTTTSCKRNSDCDYVLSEFNPWLIGGVFIEKKYTNECVSKDSPTCKACKNSYCGDGRREGEEECDETRYCEYRNSAGGMNKSECSGDNPLWSKQPDIAVAMCELEAAYGSSNISPCCYKDGLDKWQYAPCKSEEDKNCSADCKKIVNRCGDRKVSADEDCDQGSACLYEPEKDCTEDPNICDQPNTCFPRNVEPCYYCKYNPLCGDGKIDIEQGESCDKGRACTLTGEKCTNSQDCGGKGTCATKDTETCIGCISQESPGCSGLGEFPSSTGHCCDGLVKIDFKCQLAANSCPYPLATLNEGTLTEVGTADGTSMVDSYGKASVDAISKLEPKLTALRSACEAQGEGANLLVSPDGQPYISPETPSAAFTGPAVATGNPYEVDNQFPSSVTASVKYSCCGKVDCAGVEDVCGVCNGDGNSCRDCRGGHDRNSVKVDKCGVCEGNGSSCSCDADSEGAEPSGHIEIFGTGTDKDKVTASDKAFGDLKFNLANDETIKKLKYTCELKEGTLSQSDFNYSPPLVDMACEQKPNSDWECNLKSLVVYTCCIPNSIKDSTTTSTDTSTTTEEQTSTTLDPSPITTNSEQTTTSVSSTTTTTQIQESSGCCEGTCPTGETCRDPGFMVWGYCYLGGQCEPDETTTTLIDETTTETQDEETTSTTIDDSSTWYPDDTSIGTPTTLLETETTVFDLTTTTLPGTPMCGDGVKEGDEECDDGKTCFGSTLEELKTCQTDADCPDILGSPLSCRQRDNDGCSNECKFEKCGDGILQPGEECEYVKRCDGASDNSKVCLSDGDCSLGGKCIVAELSEGCGNDCKTSFCGDGEVRGAEECDPGSECSETFGGDCTKDDTRFRNGLVPQCEVEGGALFSGCCELRDDLSTSYLCSVKETEFCTSECKKSVCGDGYVNPSKEQCDPKETREEIDPRGACGSDCRYTCGNGVTDPGEQCDPGSSCMSSAVRQNDCTSDSSVCELGVDSCIVNGGSFSPLDSPSENSALCNFDCTLKNCGNGILDSGEECDGGGQCEYGGFKCQSNLDCPPTQDILGSSRSNLCLAASTITCARDCTRHKYTCLGQGEAVTGAESCCTGFEEIDGKCTYKSSPLCPHTSVGDQQELWFLGEGSGITANAAYREAEMKAQQALSVATKQLEEQCNASDGDTLKTSGPFLTPLNNEQACVTYGLFKHKCYVQIRSSAACCRNPEYTPDPVKRDCAGVEGGDAKGDSCGVCNGDGTSCLCSGLEQVVIEKNRYAETAVGEGYDDMSDSVNEAINFLEGKLLRRRESLKAECLELGGQRLVTTEDVYSPKIVSEACHKVENNGVESWRCEFEGSFSAQCCGRELFKEDFDCAGTPFGSKSLDACGVCGGDGTSCQCPADYTPYGEGSRTESKATGGDRDISNAFNQATRGLAAQLAFDTDRFSPDECYRKWGDSAKVVIGIGEVSPKNLFEACEKFPMGDEERWFCELKQTFIYQCCVKSDENSTTTTFSTDTTNIESTSTTLEPSPITTNAELTTTSVSSTTTTTQIQEFSGCCEGTCPTGYTCQNPGYIVWGSCYWGGKCEWEETTTTLIDETTTAIDSSTLYSEDTSQDSSSTWSPSSTWFDSSTTTATFGVSTTTILEDEATYRACINGFCEIARGDFEDECSSDRECGHKACTGGFLCRQVEGGFRADECEEDSDCGHNECSANGFCGRVLGGGPDLCTNSDECNHFECSERGLCERAPGEGVDSCSDDAECGYKICSADGYCEQIAGQGENQCDNHLECGHKTCVEGYCKQVPGAAVANDCEEHEQCPRRYVCNEQQVCAIIGEEGADMCSPEFGCKGPLTFNQDGGEFLQSKMSARAGINSSHFLSVNTIESYHSVLGSNDARIKISIYQDIRCGMCKFAMKGLIPELLSRYVITGVAQITFKEFPLIARKNEMKLAEAAQCAGIQGKYLQYLQKLYLLKGEVEDAKLVALAKEVELNENEFEKCLSNHEQAQVVKAHREEAKALDLPGTPAFIINGQRVLGARPMSEFVKVIEEHLKKVAH